MKFDVDLAFIFLYLYQTPVLTYLHHGLETKYLGESTL